MTFMERFKGFFTHYEIRKLEWCIVIYTIGFGLWLVLPPAAMNTESFTQVLLIMPETSWGFAYTFIGIAHGYAMKINGRAAWTPWVRAVTLLMNSLMFQTIFWAIAASNPWGTGAYTYGFFAFVFCGAAIVSAAEQCGEELKIIRARRQNG